LQLIASILLLYCSLSTSRYLVSKTEEIKKFNKYIKNSKKFDYVFLDNNELYIDIGQNTGEFIKAYARRRVNNKDFQLVYTLNVDESFMDKFSVDVESGRVFDEADFLVSENDPIPVILGSEYKEIFKIDDIITSLDYNNNLKYLKVIGFLKTGYYLADGKSPDDLNLLDKYIIYPQQEISLSEEASTDSEAEIYYKIDLVNNSFNVDITLKLNFYSFFGTLILSLLFSLFLGAIPIYKTMKLTIDELVRGKE